VSERPLAAAYLSFPFKSDGSLIRASRKNLAASSGGVGLM